MRHTAVQTSLRALGRRWWRPALAAGGVIVVAAVMRNRWPDPSATLAVLRGTAAGPLLAAVGFQALSLAAFAEQQRLLLTSMGVRLPPTVSLAVTCVRSAIAVVLPAGAAVSASYAFRRFRSYGATPATAAATISASGLASVVGLAVLYASDLLMAVGPTVFVAATLSAVAGVAVLAFRRRRMRTPQTRSGTHGLVQAGRAPRRGRLWETTRQTVAAARSVPAHRWLIIVCVACANWFADLACLIAAADAVGLSVPVATVAQAYLATQLIRQIPASPGGAGIVEASLIIPLAAAGVAIPAATAAVLVYRLVSCWGLPPFGLICWVATRRTSRERAIVGP